MTSKEKAEELYILYKNVLGIKNDMRPGKNPFAQQCAMICVEQILIAIDNRLDDSIENMCTEYWNDVLEHIKNK